jgi:hypothetical protein
MSPFFEKCYPLLNGAKISRSSQTLQSYSTKQLTEMLQRNGFRVLDQCGIDGSKFIENTTERIFMLAKKVQANGA